MSHHASNNWGNPTSERGIQIAMMEPNKIVVRSLISGPEAESLKWVQHHSCNRAWLEMALDIESRKTIQSAAVLKLITELLGVAK